MSSFGLAAGLSAGVAVITVGVALVAAIRAHHSGRPVIVPVARVLAVGFALIVVAATASPHGWPPERYGFGDLILDPGRGGLSHLDQAIAEPMSVAALLLFGNVALYVPLTFSATLGWRGRLWSILGAALALSLSVEAIQYLALERIAATDDVILNLTGAVIGIVAGVAIRDAARRLAPARSG